MAGISAFQVTRASLEVALSRGVMRVTGSVVGASIGLIVLRLFVYQPLPFCLCLFVVAFIGYFGFAISRFSYGWLIGAVTANLIMLIRIHAAAGSVHDRRRSRRGRSDRNRRIIARLRPDAGAGQCWGCSCIRPAQAAAAGVLASPLGN